MLDQSAGPHSTICVFLLPASLALLLLAAPGCLDPVRLPEKAPGPSTSADAVVQELAYSYQHQDLEALKSILADDGARNAQYLFLLSDPTDQGETQWGYVEEVRIHRRMFRPGHPDEGETSVPPELWLAAVDVHLTRQEPFAERKDLYSVNHGADGKLDPDIWKAVDARYGTNVFFETQGDQTPDFQVTGEANFVVIEDLAKHAGDTGKFLLYTWEDLKWQPKPGGAEGATAQTWTNMKELYR